MVPFFSDCSGKSGKSGKAVFSTFFSNCPRKTGKSGKVVPVTASLTPYGLPQKIPLYRLFRFFPRTLQKMSRLSVSLPIGGSASRVPRTCSTCTDRSSGIPTAMPRTLRAVSAAPKKVPSTAAKTAPSHPLRVAKFRADAPTALRL